MTTVIIDKTLPVNEADNGRKIIYYNDAHELSGEQKLALMFNGYTLMHEDIKADIIERCVKKEEELTWGKGFTFIDKNGVQTRVKPK